MGYGDELMGSGVARGAAARGKRIAFGDGKRIIWHAIARDIYRNNPNVAPPGSEGDADIEWVRHYPGARLYHTGFTRERWHYSDWRATPGELFFDEGELAWAQAQPSGLVVIEPNVKGSAPNKQWPVYRYSEVARALAAAGFEVAQFATGDHVLPGVKTIHAPTFRHAVALLARARLYVGPEGGLHHGAAAVGIPAVVIFGGFTHPRNTGYDGHVNIFIGEKPCGSRHPCGHCHHAMMAILSDRVFQSAMELIGEAGPRRLATG